jgi:hypothetical protein
MLYEIEISRHCEGAKRPKPFVSWDPPEAQDFGRLSMCPKQSHNFLFMLRLLRHSLRSFLAMTEKVHFPEFQGQYTTERK